MKKFYVLQKKLLLPKLQLEFSQKIKFVQSNHVQNIIIIFILKEYFKIKMLNLYLHQFLVMFFNLNLIKVMLLGKSMIQKFYSKLELKGQFLKIINQFAQILKIWPKKLRLYSFGLIMIEKVNLFQKKLNLYVQIPILVYQFFG
jgi:hypothetical protein